MIREEKVLEILLDSENSNLNHESNTEYIVIYNYDQSIGHTYTIYKKPDKILTPISNYYKLNTAQRLLVVEINDSKVVKITSNTGKINQSKLISAIKKEL